MIKIQQFKVEPKQDEYFEEMVLDEFKIRKEDIYSFEIVKKSLDARKAPVLIYIYTFLLSLPEKIEKRIVKQNKNASFCNPPIQYKVLQKGTKVLKNRPIVVGSGPAGLFCAYLLAQEGFRPILLERGFDVDKRTEEVNRFFEGGPLNPISNVQFGEGGAGTFSDGKLNTGVKDKEGRNNRVLELFVENGAPKEILYEGKPHIGTDLLVKVVKNIRNEIIRLGGEVLFEHMLTDLDIQDGSICSITVTKEQKKQVTFPCETLVLAIGHSARDTYRMLLSKHFPMESKDFAVGVRVEHSQEFINKSQYGKDYDTLYPNLLPASPYKLTARAKDGRGVYSFCMCPGGFIVNASSVPNCLAINGMSYSDRSSKHANSAIVVSVSKDDFLDDSPLGGIEFQEMLEQNAYKLLDGIIPVQFYTDFRNNTQTNKDVSLLQTFSIKGACNYANVRSIFPKEIANAILDGMEQFNKQIPGFASDDTLLAGVESRTSAPVRILRDETYQTNIHGIYPCGEGAGYAGGIMSAAMDGLKIAEAIIKEYTMDMD